MVFHTLGTSAAFPSQLTSPSLALMTLWLLSSCHEAVVLWLHVCLLLAPALEMLSLTGQDTNGNGCWAAAHALLQGASSWTERCWEVTLSPHVFPGRVAACTVNLMAPPSRCRSRSASSPALLPTSLLPRAYHPAAPHISNTCPRFIQKALVPPGPGHTMVERWPPALLGA